MKGFAKRALFCALAIAIALLAACDSEIITGLGERTLPPDAQSTPAAVPPGGGDVAIGTMPVTLYYRYNDEAYLAPYVVELELPGDKAPEQALIERLLQGPDGADGNFSMLIDPNTQVVSIQERTDHLEITLSQEYLEYLTIRLGRYDADSEEYEEEVRLRKHLALYSIVNTVTEMGRYSRVMLMIDRGSGVVDKLKRSEAGIDALGSRAIDPIGRDTSCILTVDRCAALVLEALRDKQWSRLGGLVATSDVDGTVAPYSDELADILQARPSLIEFTIAQEETFMPRAGGEEPEQAVLSVNLKFRDALGNLIERGNIPLRFLRRSGIWQITYTSLDAMIPQA